MLIRVIATLLLALSMLLLDNPVPVSAQWTGTGLACPAASSGVTCEQLPDGGVHLALENKPCVPGNNTVAEVRLGTTGLTSTTFVASYKQSEESIYIANQAITTLKFRRFGGSLTTQGTVYGETGLTTMVTNSGSFTGPDSGVGASVAQIIVAVGSDYPMTECKINGNFYISPSTGMLTETPNPSPTWLPTTTATLTPTATVTSTPTITRTPTITFTPTETGTPTITSTPTETGTPTLTATVTATATITETPTITITPTSTSTGTATPTPTATALYGGPVIMAPSSVTVDELLAYDVEEYLNAHIPAPYTTNIYAISHSAAASGGVYVSVVGLDPTTAAPYRWSYEDNVIWKGSLLLVNGEFSPYRPSIPRENAGGGADVAFPWTIGTQMMFGSRGIHGEQDNSVDWVSGDDFGSSAAGPEVYASGAGKITNVCEDAIQMGVTIEGPNYRFGYLHLEKDSGLVEGKDFTRGQYIGRLKYGTFDGECGYANQQDNHYHLHWTFQQNNGKFQAEAWTLFYNSSEWKKGNNTVKVGQWMLGGGGTGNEPLPTITPGGPTATPGGPGGPTDPGGGTPAVIPRFWTYLLMGVKSLYNVLLAALPTSAISRGEGIDMFQMSGQSARELIGIANIFLVNDIINLTPVLILVAIIIIWRVIMFIPAIVLVVVRLFKSLPFL